MSATIIDGKAVADEIKLTVAADVASLKSRGKSVKLVALQVGAHPASKIYTNMQARACESVGIDYELLELPDTTDEQGLAGQIAALNDDSSVSGVILQMPLPPDINARRAQVTISPAKDVEAMHPENMGRLFYGGGIVAPCTPMAAVELLNRACEDLSGKEVVIVGHSEIVGKPIAAMLLESPSESPTVTVCHVATRDLGAHSRRADILIVAAGVSQARWLSCQRQLKAGQEVGTVDLAPLIGADMVGDGAIVIDVAINRIPASFDDQGQPQRNEKGRIAMRTVGDVDFEGVLDKVSAITPVPGGVGPVTVAMLLRNTVACATAAI